MQPPPILIAGIGNIFMGDDAFGVEVVRRLLERPQPAGVQVVDYGIRGFDLAFALMEEHDLVILVDATPQGSAPGTLYEFEPDPADLEMPKSAGALDAHSMNPLRVLRMVRALGGRVHGIRIVGCEPEFFGSEDDPAVGLSAIVAAAVEPAVLLIERIVAARLERAQGSEVESSLQARGSLFNGG